MSTTCYIFLAIFLSQCYSQDASTFMFFSINLLISFYSNALSKSQQKNYGWELWSSKMQSSIIFVVLMLTLFSNRAITPERHLTTSSERVKISRLGTYIKPWKSLWQAGLLVCSTKVNKNFLKSRQPLKWINLCPRRDLQRHNTTNWIMKHVPITISSSLFFFIKNQFSFASLMLITPLHPFLELSMIRLHRAKSRWNISSLTSIQK